MKVMVERDGFLLRLNDCNVFQKILECQVSEHKVVLKVMTVSVRHLEKKSSSLDNEKRLLENTNKELMRRSAEDKNLVGKGARKRIRR